MAWPCPGCGRALDRSPEAWALRCPACRGLVRARALESGGRTRAYEVEIAGRPETRRRVELPWGEEDRRRLAAWLAWSTTVTLGLVLVLYALARWWR